MQFIVGKSVFDFFIDTNLGKTLNSITDRPIKLCGDGFETHRYGKS